MFGYIYKTTNLINGKIYIGKKQSNVFVPDYFGSGKLIRRAIKKYGIKNFKVEILDVAESLDELNYKEKFNITLNGSYYKNGYGYNIAKGGDGGNLLIGATKEQVKEFKEGCRKRSLGESNPNYGNGDKIRGDKNPSKRADVRKKLSKKLSGKNNPMYGKKQTKEAIETRIRKTREKNNGKFPNQFTKNPNTKHWRDKPYYLYNGDKLLKTFKNKIHLLNYCHEIGFSRKMVLDCLNNGLCIKDLNLYKGSPTYQKNLNAQNKYPNYNFKVENTEVTNEIKIS